jgi:hypothetical protein
MAFVGRTDVKNPSAPVEAADRQVPRDTDWDWVSIHPSCPRCFRPPSEDDHLESGMVVALTGYVWQEGVGAVFRRGHRPHHRRRPRSAHLQPVLG